MYIMYIYYRIKINCNLSKSITEKSVTSTVNITRYNRDSETAGLNNTLVRERKIWWNSNGYIHV